MPFTVVWLRQVGQEDQPNRRTLHVNPTPRGAGLALAFGMLIALLLLGEVPWAFWLLVIGFTAVGAWDDRASLSASVKLVLQIALAVPIAVNSSLLLNLPIATAIPSAIFLVALVNATNFMDGVNGMTGFHTVVWGLTFAIAFHLLDRGVWSTLAVVLSAVGLAFLPWNVPRARVFLGDSGSYLIGAFAGALALLGAGLGQPIAFFAPLTIYAVDTSVTLVRRKINGKSLTEPHREHVFQRLALRGWGHGTTALTTTLFTIGVSILGLLTMQASSEQRILLTAGIGILAILYLTLPQLAARLQQPSE